MGAGQGAFGESPDLMRSSFDDEVDYVVDLVVKSVERLRTLSPLWEMHQEGIDINSIQWTPH